MQSRRVAQSCGNEDQAKWMCLRVQRAMENTDQIPKEERQKEMLAILDFHQKCKDISEADSISRTLLQLGWINASTEPKVVDSFCGFVESSLEHGFVEPEVIGDILPHLHRLVELGDIALFSTLRAAAASGSSSKRDFLGRNLLHVAAEKGHTVLLELLLNLQRSHPSFDLDVHGRDAALRTPLYLAIHHGHESSYRLLRQWGASPHTRSAASHSPLASAASGNHLGIMEDLISAR